MAPKRKTYNITEERQLRLERLAIHVSQRIGKQIRWSELLTYLIDKFDKEAADEIISEHEIENRPKLSDFFEKKN
ncbi:MULTISPECIES: hypothetical protein [Providencia]|uniref:Uncharacterized protein n=1 Tax=Providencia sneebia DSM 19967 TaxID=1141660 RepID=K8VXF7_9GAMM|nr:MULTISPECIES: hypothetical protein [Providencia]EKT52844.1 hypothetical protein OO7_16340 [Providencia sneebia DSM 19967]